MPNEFGSGVKDKLRDLYDSGKVNECIAESKKVLALNPDDMEVAKILCDCYYLNKKYSEFLDCFKSVSNRESLECGMGFYRKARVAINKTYKSSEEKKLAWKGLSGPAESMFGDSLQMALDGNFSESKRVFNNAVDIVFDKLKIKNELKKCHSSFIDILSLDKPLPKLPENKRIRKVIVSGMGWSGSGAIYDYLSEFDCVVPISGETQYIEGSKSLRKIRGSLGSKRNTFKEILRFYYYSIVGYAYFEESNDFKLFRHARKKINSSKNSSLISIFNKWCACAAHLYHSDKSESMGLFVHLSTFTVNNLSISKSFNDNKVFLLDNVIHIGKASCIEFLEDTSVMCAFRDPRSNYVAMVREAGHYNESAKSFSESQAAKLLNSWKSYNKAKKLTSKDLRNSISSIQFEEFILSERYRDSLATALGLDLFKRDKYSKLKPWESMRNVILHQEYAQQDEIRLIENELGEYCYEPCIKPLNEINK